MKGEKEVVKKVKEEKLKKGKELKMEEMKGSVWWS